MHGPHHAGDEAVDAIAFLDLRDQGRDAALVVLAGAKVGKDELLEAVDLVLQVHEVRDGLVAFIRVVNAFEGDVFLVLEQAVELSVVAVEAELGEDQGDVGSYQRTVACRPGI